MFRLEQHNPIIGAFWGLLLCAPLWAVLAWWLWKC